MSTFCVGIVDGPSAVLTPVLRYSRCCSLLMLYQVRLSRDTYRQTVEEIATAVFNRCKALDDTRDVIEILYVGVAEGGIAAIDVAKLVGSWLAQERRINIRMTLVMIATPFPGSARSYARSTARRMLAPLSLLPDSALWPGDWALSAAVRMRRLLSIRDQEAGVSPEIVDEVQRYDLTDPLTRNVDVTAAVIDHDAFATGELGGIFNRVAYIRSETDEVVDAKRAIEEYRHAFTPQILGEPSRKVSGGHVDLARWPRAYGTAIREVVRRYA